MMEKRTHPPPPQGPMPAANGAPLFAGAAVPPPAPRPAGASRGVPPVFSGAAFLLAAIGVMGAPLVALLGDTLLGDRFGLPAPLAAGLAILAGAVVAGAGGFAAAALTRRLAFYEIVAACLLLLGALLGAIPLFLPQLRGSSAVLVSWEAQGRLVLVLGLTLTGSVAGLCAFVGSSLSYLAFGSGRFDPSLSYELFVAQNHLRLSPRTLVAVFLVVVTGVLPGLVAMLGYSLVEDVVQRRAARRGELRLRRKLPATLLMTLISIGGVVIGVWALTVVLSVMSGFEADLKGKILGNNAHAVVLKYGNDFSEWREVRKKVLQVPGVVGATPFLLNEVFLATDEAQGAVMKGIDPATANSVIDLGRNIDEGKLEYLDHPEQIPEPGYKAAGARALEKALTDSEQEEKRLRESPPTSLGASGSSPPPPSKEKRKVLPGLAIGRELSRALKVYVGDTVNVVSPFGDMGPSGPQPRSRPFRVAAVFYSGMYEYDSKFAYMSLAEAQRFFAAGELVTGLELKVEDFDAARAIARQVLVALDGYPYRTKDWGEMNRSLFSALMMEKVVMAVILGFIVLVASFIIIATLIMLALEKTREIAVLKSMGAADPSIMKIFVIEGLIIGAVGTVFGLLLGYGTCLFIDRVGIPLNPEVYYISALPVLIDGAQFGLVALAALVLAYLATIYPATKASRLRPVEGLRSE
jgi:lipoprotein-releasing system permease protein